MKTLYYYQIIMYYYVCIKLCIIIKKNTSKEQLGYIKLKTQFREMTSIKLLIFWYFHRNKSFLMWKRGYDLVTESFI